MPWTRYELDQPSPYLRRGEVHGGDSDHDHEDDQPGGAVLEEVYRLEEDEPDPAAAHQTQDRREPDVRVEPVDRERDKWIDDLWQHGGPDDLEAIRTGGGDRLERSWVDALDRLRVQLSEHAHVVERERDHPRRIPDTQQHGGDDDKDEDVDRPDDREDEAHRDVDPHGDRIAAHDVPSSDERQGQRGHDR